MRFNIAWSQVVSENYVLKLVVLGLFILTLLFGVTTLKLSTQGALIIERSCRTNVLTSSSDKRTASEIDAFLKIALDQRFSSNATADRSFLSEDEINNRESEQKEFKNRQMLQSFLFNSFNEKDGLFEVDADRIIRVGDIRSAFKFPLKVILETVSRSQSNPYGLVLRKVELLNQGEKK